MFGNSLTVPKRTPSGQAADSEQLPEIRQPESVWMRKSQCWVRAAWISNIRRKTNFTAVELSPVAPFVQQVGWYNSVLPPCLHLPYRDDTLAEVVLSTPAMFEEAFLPFLEQKSYEKLSDPIDQCVRLHITTAVSQVSIGVWLSSEEWYKHQC